MNDGLWYFVCEFARKLGAGIEVPEQLRSQSYADVMAWISDRYRKSWMPVTNRKGAEVPFWRRKAQKHNNYMDALSDAQAAFFRHMTEEIKNRMQRNRAAVGMGDFVESAESEEAARLCREVEKKPSYEGQHRDIVRLALKAGKTVPVRVVADYLDEPWAVAEMLRRTRNLGIKLFFGNSRELRADERTWRNYPAVRSMFARRSGKPFALHAVFCEDTWLTGIIGKPILSLLEVFKGRAEAEHYMACLHPQEWHSMKLRLESLSITEKDEELKTIGSPLVACDSRVTSQILQRLEMRLDSN